MDKPRLCIPTRDPTSSGGVHSMARFVYRTAERSGYDPFLLCNRLSRESDVRIQDLIVGDWSREVESIIYDGMETVLLPRYLPEFEFLQYILNNSHWKKYLFDADLYFGVGGHIHCCQPLFRNNRTFGFWVATLLWDERKTRLDEQSLPMRLRHLISRPVLERIEGNVYKDADIVYTLSEHTAKRIQQRYDVDESSIEIVQYPIDTSQFEPDGPTVQDTSEESPTVLFVGRFNASRKNTPLLIRAFARVHQKVPEARLQLIGDEPSEDLEKLVSRLGIDDEVDFISHIPNKQLPAYYRSADVFVIPSHQEGLAIVGLEAMACGTPVVSTQCGGPEDYVVDGETGYLVSEHEAAALAEKIHQLLTDDELSDQLGSRAREEIEQRYSQESLRSQFEDAFETLRTNRDQDT